MHKTNSNKKNIKKINNQKKTTTNSATKVQTAKPTSLGSIIFYRQSIIIIIRRRQTNRFPWNGDNYYYDLGKIFMNLMYSNDILKILSAVSMTLWRSNATDDVAPIYYLRAPLLITIIKTCQRVDTVRSFTHSLLLFSSLKYSSVDPFITRTLLYISFLYVY